MIEPRLPPQSAGYSDPGSSLFNKLWYLFFDGVLITLRALLKLVTSGTHAERLARDKAGKLLVDATKYPLGALYFETDRGVEYQVRLVAKIQTWVYAAGEMRGTTLADVPADLGADDEGFLFHDEQYQHSYRWDGTVWAFGPSDDHLAGQCTFSAQGATPLGGVWQVCDGTVVPVSQGDGTVANFTAPVLSGDTFLMGGGPTAVRAATAAHWDAAAKTEDEATHTHAIAQGSINNPAVGTPTTVDTGANTGAGTAHHHALTNTNALLLAPSLTNHGLPQNIGLVFWMRQ